jgi:hypothetical protein
VLIALLALILNWISGNPKIFKVLKVSKASTAYIRKTATLASAGIGSGGSVFNLVSPR